MCVFLNANIVRACVCVRAMACIQFEHYLIVPILTPLNVVYTVHSVQLRKMRIDACPPTRKRKTVS